MNKKLQEIYDGWKNLLVPDKELEPHIEKIAAMRLNICRTCPFNSDFHVTIRPDRHCTKCGCTLAAKTRSLISECPDVPKRWGAEVIDKDFE